MGYVVEELRHLRYNLYPLPMDNQLRDEIESILQMQDEVLQRGAASKIALYLLTLPSPPEEYKDLLQRFIDKVFEILPASNLPQLLKESLGLKGNKQKRVSFAEVHVDVLPWIQPLSPEGREQQVREAGTLSIASTDTQRKFIPKQAFSQGLTCATRSISLLPSSLSNKFCPKISENFSQSISRPKTTAQQILDNPSVLKEFE